ncbi:MAG: endonuclease/exonuclease/phosphatase family protein [Promethearchaeota archaeon]
MKKEFKILVMGLFFVPLIFSLITYSLSEIPVNTVPKYQLKIMTYNIHFGQGYDDKLDLERLAQNILSEDPDILGLQEVENGRITSEGIDMATWMAERLNMYHFYYPAENEHQGGVALLSKYPIKSASGFKVPSISSQRVLVHGVIIVNQNLELDVYVTHLGLWGWDEDMMVQVNFVLNTISATSTCSQKILMGDFNLEPNTPEIAKIKTWFTDTGGLYPRPRTFPSYKLYVIPDETIDYIFARGYKTIDDSHVVTDYIPESDTPAEFGSDHRAIVSTLTF